MKIKEVSNIPELYNNCKIFINCICKYFEIYLLQTLNLWQELD